jgi:hypothetical protein
MSSNVSVMSAELRMEFGEIDIYLFDQLLRGRFDRRQHVLDAGRGAGRIFVFPATPLRCAGGSTPIRRSSIIGEQKWSNSVER